MNSLRNELFKKDDEIHSLKFLLSLKESELRGLQHSTGNPSIQLGFIKQEVERSKKRLRELQIRCEEEAAREHNLNKQVKNLICQLQAQNRLNDQDSNILQKWDSDAESLMQELEKEIRRLGPDSYTVLKKVQNIRDSKGWRLQKLHEEISAMYERHLTSFKAMMDRNQILIAQEQAENHHLHQLIGALTNQVNSLHKQLLSEEVNSRALAKKRDLECKRNVQQMKVIESKLEGIKQDVHYKIKECNIPPLVQQLEMQKTLSTDTNLQKDSSGVFFEMPRQKESETFFPPSFSQLNLPLDTEDFGVTSEKGGGHIADQSSTEEIDSPVPIRSAVSSSKGVKNQSVGIQASLGAPEGQDNESTNNGYSKQNDSNISLRIPTGFPEETSQPLNIRCITQTDPAFFNSTHFLKIKEVNSLGYFVRLFNTSYYQDIDLSGHLILQYVGGYPVSLYRVPQHIWLPARQYITIWAAVSNVTNNPPTDLLWKQQRKFRAGPECTTFICKPNGQPIAWYTSLHRFSNAVSCFDDSNDVLVENVPLTQELDNLKLTNIPTPQNLPRTTLPLADSQKRPGTALLKKRTKKNSSSFTCSNAPGLDNIPPLNAYNTDNEIYLQPNFLTMFSNLNEFSSAPHYNIASGRILRPYTPSGRRTVSLSKKHNLSASQHC
nr:PREDICTED: prelamin-A/C-like isoform X2 [Latimeria chalumnae]|eukprot:XP_014349805.1 PREDICTED: prelamin-A/C-like isoform X2 [Latimeria chalumnae]